MNYIGSKHKLTDFIKTTIIKKVGNTNNKTIAELFGGTGAIARSFKNEAKQIIINDIEPYSYVLAQNYIGNSKKISYKKWLDELNNLKPVAGFIFEEYSQNGKANRIYFSEINGKKIDAIRTKIEEWKIQKKITKNEYYFLVASLLESADKVANTASVYGAYLKKIKKSAQKELILNPALFVETKTKHLVFNTDANQLISKIKGDILYLDPPYNERQYGANYHLLNTIALYDTFIPKGKTGMREYAKSDYCKKGNVKIVFEDLIKKANFKYLFLSYNNEGLMTEKEVAAIMKKYGKYSLAKTNYQRFKADNNRKQKANSTTEYLHILEK